MVYVYKKEIGGKSYYYLRLSKRVNGKLVVKDIAYLGSNPAEVEKKLDKLSNYKGEIRKSYRNIRKFLQSNHYLDKIKEKKLKKDDYLERELLEAIEAARLHYNNHFLKLDPLTIKEAYKNYLVDFAYNTTSLEGNTITLREAHRLLGEDLLPKNRTLREAYDLQNTERVFFWLLDNNPKIDESLIIKIHDDLMERIDNRKGYKTSDNRPFRAKFDSTPAKYVKADMGILMELFKNNWKGLHPLALIAIYHCKFERIHPFADGNGRTGRMLMNLMLMQAGYPPLIVAKKNRSTYLDSLSKGDEANLKNINPKYFKRLVNYLAQELLESYWNIFNV